MKTVLVVTKSDDHEGVQLTLDAIRNSGAQAIRFNTDEFPTKVGLDLRYVDGRQRLVLRTDGGEWNLSELDAVYYRRVNHAAQLPQEMDEQLRRVSIQESRATVEGLITALPCFHLDPLWRVRQANNKQWQLHLAQELGLEIPRTLMTNDAAAVRDFAKQCPNGIVTKMLASFAVYEDGQEKVVFTTPVEDGDLEALEGLDLCPMTFQERIPKQLEYRSTVVGNTVFSSVIDSQQQKLTEVDWRRDGIGLIDKWEPKDLPREVEAKLMRLMDIMGLHYGAADFLLTPDGRCVFLEVNPVGEYFWLDEQRDARISETLAGVLLGTNRREFSGR